MMCNYYDGCTTMMMCTTMIHVTNYEECFYFCVEWGGVHPDIHYIDRYTTHLYTTHAYTLYIYTLHTYIDTLHMHIHYYMISCTTMMIYYYVVGGVNHSNVWMNNPKQTASALGVRSSTMTSLTIIPSNLTRSILLLVYVSLNHPYMSSMSYAFKKPSKLRLN